MGGHPPPMGERAIVVNRRNELTPEELYAQSDQEREDEYPGDGHDGKCICHEATICPDESEGEHAT